MWYSRPRRVVVPAEQCSVSKSILYHRFSASFKTEPSPTKHANSSTCCSQLSISCEAMAAKLAFAAYVASPINLIRGLGEVQRTFYAHLRRRRPVQERRSERKGSNFSSASVLSVLIVSFRTFGRAGGRCKFGYALCNVFLRIDPALCGFQPHLLGLHRAAALKQILKDMKMLSPIESPADRCCRLPQEPTWLVLNGQDYQVVLIKDAGHRLRLGFRPPLAGR